jgi:hypothetical protein
LNNLIASAAFLNNFRSLADFSRQCIPRLIQI